MIVAEARYKNTGFEQENVMKIKGLLLICCIALLQGCPAGGPWPQSEQKERAIAYKAAMDMARQNCLNHASDPRLESVGDKIPWLASDISTASVSDTSRAGIAEQEALLVYVQLKQQCQAMRRYVQGKYEGIAHPGYLTIDRIADTRFVTAMIDLHDGRISYGELNRLHQQIGEQSRDDIEALYDAAQLSRPQADKVAEQLEIKHQQALAAFEVADAESDTAWARFVQP